MVRGEEKGMNPLTPVHMAVPLPPTSDHHYPREKPTHHCKRKRGLRKGYLEKKSKIEGTYLELKGPTTSTNR